MRPFVSVVIPVFNGERFISDAVTSIRNQKGAKLEILVIDDGSTDGTAEEVRRMGDPVTYVHQDNQGPGVARNTGISRAKGRWIAFLDADDVWPEGRLASMLDKFDQEPALELVMGHVRSESIENAAEVPEALLRPHVLPLFGAGLFRREVFGKVGMIDAGLRYSEDQDWFLRAKEKGIALTIIQEVVLVRRLHAANMTRGTGWKEAGILKVLKKSLDRRRAAGGRAGELPKLSDFEDKGAIDG